MCSRPAFRALYPNVFAPSLQSPDARRTVPQALGDFTLYDHRQPEAIPEALQHSFSVVVADPPFLARPILTLALAQLVLPPPLLQSYHFHVVALVMNFSLCSFLTL